MSGDSTKRKGKEAPGLREEYDFSKMKGGVRGKQADAYRQGSNLVLLDPDVAEAFPDSSAVNKALRTVLDAAKAIPRRPSNKTLQRTRGSAVARKPKGSKAGR
jgi:hypothetical protein